MSLWLPNGPGETLGDQLATGKNLVMLAEGKVYYVGATNASDSSNNGLEALRPFATIGQAITDASNDDIIILKDGFTQTLTATQVISENLIFVGGGKNSGIPTVSLRMNAAASSMLTISGSYVEFRNIKFPAQSQSNSAARIVCSGTAIMFRDCYFECNGNDAAPVVSLTSNIDEARFEGCTFVNTATDAAARPHSAIKTAVGATVSRLYIEDCVFDGGSTGFYNQTPDAYPVDLTQGTIIRCRGQGNSLLRGADIAFLHASSPVGWVQLSTSTGGAFVRDV